MYVCVVEWKVEWFDQVQVCVGVCVQVDYVVGVWWNFGGDEDDVEYVLVWLGWLELCNVCGVFG